MDDDSYALLKSGENCSGVCLWKSRGLRRLRIAQGERRRSLEEKGKTSEGDVEEERGEKRPLEDSARWRPVGFAVGG